VSKAARQDRGAGGAVQKARSTPDTRRRHPERDPRGDRHNLRGAVDLGRATVPISWNADPIVVAIDDPLPDQSRPPLSPAPRIQATANRRVDILEMELSHGRITQSEYAIGRIVQAVFERASGARLGSGGWHQGDRVDQATAHELAIIYAITDTHIVVAWLRTVERALGHIDARLVRQVLADRMSFADVAAARGRAGRQGTSYYADRFRDALETLDNALAARGVAPTVTDETHGEVPEIRAARAEPENVETDASGRVVPAGKGYRLVDDPSSRWVPGSKRKRLEAEAAGVDCSTEM
jgi:hypothetical protein